MDGCAQDVSSLESKALKIKKHEMKPEKIVIQGGSRPLYRTGRIEGLEVPPVQPILDALIIQRDGVIAEIGAGAVHYTLPIARHLQALGGSGIVYADDFSKTAVKGIEKNTAARGGGCSCPDRLSFPGCP